MLKFPLLEVGEVDKAMEQGQETLSVFCSATEDIGFLHLEEGKQGGRGLGSCAVVLMLRASG